ncbi:MAG: hypothetical protein KDK70_10035 [Myxococcales bacterium]|nr:hypothetical protein [Myxococcales bacterium]
MGDREVDDGAQHQRRADHGVDEELDRSRDPLLGTPDPDDEVHGDEHQLPEGEEQDEVQGAERPDHPGLEHQHGGHELGPPLVDRVPRAPDAQRGQQRGQQDDEEREAVDAHVVVDAELGDPRDVGDELHVGLADGEAGGQRERDQQFEHAEGDADAVRQLGLALGQRGHHQGAHDRQHEQCGEDVVHG